ncbi:MAG TPA: UDP-N-acetylmuramoyl-L-alanine--D-glutamate ligase [Rhodothermales bacterium]|nr:UDP-N-acetylmuramoyl-L-alanine--D-glutamate ligase [Rhodothermales bacterium]
MTPEEVEGKRITVVGAARSGLGAARLLSRAGATVFLTERGELGDAARILLNEAGVHHESGGHSARALDADFFVISPGVPSSSELVQAALAGGLSVFSEIEAASWFCRAPIIAITGSNGKTTTTSLTGYLYKNTGRSTLIAGNIGFPFSDIVWESKPEDVVVLEVSSFQLDHIDTFRPRVSVLLNITPDHLDRYDHDFDKYARSKFRIFENQKDDDVLIYNHDDALVQEHVGRFAERRPVKAWGFSQYEEVEQGAFLRGDTIVLRTDGREDVLLRVDELALRGEHNVYNSMAAAVAGRALEASLDVVRESLSTFAGVPHRLEFVRELDGVRYVNDSKATNVDAVRYALGSFDEPIVLIAGGKDKGNDYGPIQRLVEERTRAVIAIGESSDKVMAELGRVAPRAERAASMEEAVRRARDLAEPGDVVLLSPACASFDMFNNYEHRGEVFKGIVQSL